MILPTESILNCESKEEAINTLSDIYGFLIESVEDVREVELTNFEVKTKYKSGIKRNEIIVAENEADMWRIYDAHHSKKKIESSAIVGTYPL